MRQLAARLGLTLDDVNAYPPHTRAGAVPVPVRRTVLAAGRADREWHDWGWRLFHEAAFVQAPWPTR